MSKDVAKPNQLKELLSKHGFSFKKQLGQNFLIDAGILEKIVESAELSQSDGVFEVGPGAGVVTRLLAERAKKVVTVEKDQSLLPVLQDSLVGFQNVEVLFADVLKVDLKEVWTRFEGCSNVSVIANLPYYVTTPILFHIFEADVPVRDIIVMVQKEVADRLMAPPGGKDYGALTVAVQYRANVSRVVQVNPACFMPPPNVESTVVRMRIREEKAVSVTDEGMFNRLVRAAFGTRRKTLLNALAGQLGFTKDQIRWALLDVGIDPNRRGETLSIEEFGILSNNLYKITR